MLAWCLCIVGNFYNEDQLKKVLEIFKGNEIESCIFLTVHYGFRRSEVLGLKWDAVEEDGKITFLHKVKMGAVGIAKIQPIQGFVSDSRCICIYRQIPECPQSLYRSS